MKKSTEREGERKYDNNNNNNNMNVLEGKKKGLLLNYILVDGSL
jgi:hypothetical protein